MIKEKLCVCSLKKTSLKEAGFIRLFYSIQPKAESVDAYV